MFKDKGLVIGILITTVLIVGGVFYFTKDNTIQIAPKVFSQDILAPKDEYKTSGFANGNYLAATDSAKVTLVEFGDYECPACILYHPFIKQLLIDYAGKINFVFRNFPLSQHKNAEIASLAVEAAGLQGKYWQMHDKVYESTSEWSTSTEAKDIFVSFAGAFGLDINKYKADIESVVIKGKVSSDVSDGNLVKLNATPTYYLNGVKIDTLPSNYDGFKSLIESELSK